MIIIIIIIIIITWRGRQRKLGEIVSSLLLGSSHIWSELGKNILLNKKQTVCLHLNTCMNWCSCRYLALVCKRGLVFELMQSYVGCCTVFTWMCDSNWCSSRLHDFIRCAWNVGRQWTRTSWPNLWMPSTAAKAPGNWLINWFLYDLVRNTADTLTIWTLIDIFTSWVYAMTLVFCYNL